MWDPSLITKELKKFNGKMLIDGEGIEFKTEEDSILFLLTWL
jgi:hypothetical protein